MVRKSDRVKIPTSRDIGSILLRGKTKGDASGGRVSDGEAAIVRRQRQIQQRRRRRDNSASNTASSDGVCVLILCYSVYSVYFFCSY